MACWLTTRSSTARMHKQMLHAGSSSAQFRSLLRAAYTVTCAACASWQDADRLPSPLRCKGVRRYTGLLDPSKRCLLLQAATRTATHQPLLMHLPLLLPYGPHSSMRMVTGSAGITATLQTARSAAAKPASEPATCCMAGLRAHAAPQLSWLAATFCTWTC
jgi:hypothetical protein